MPTFLSLLLLTWLTTLVFWLQVVAPGLQLVELTLKKQVKLNALEHLTLATLLSLSGQALVIFLLGSIIGVMAYPVMYLFTLIGLITLPTSWRVVKQLLHALPNHWLLALLGVLAACSLASTLTFTWIVTPDSFSLQRGQLHDSAWHIALINNLQQAIPPAHPSSSELVVTQYHYFYDLIVAALAANYRVPISVIYFQFFPLVLSLLLASSVAILATRLHSKKLAVCVLFWTFFGGSFAYLIPFFLPGNTWSESSFWVSQTFAMMVNPQMIFSLATVATVGWLLTLDQPTLSRTGHRWLHSLLLIIMVASIGYKSYGWMVMGALYGSFLLIKLLQTRQLSYLGWGALFGLLSLPVVWLITGFNTSSFFWLPLWYLTSMVESPDRLNYPVLKLRELTYLADGNTFGVVRVRLLEFLIFVVGNLGTRVLLFAWPLVWLWDGYRRQRLPKINPVVVALISGGLFSASFPLLFLQRGAVWNSIQFWYYTLLFANLFVAWLLVELHQRWQPSKVATVAIVSLLIGLSLPTYWVTQREKLLETEVFTRDQKNLLAQLNPQDKVLICPGDSQLYQTSLVTAFSGASIYLANQAQLSITGDEALFVTTHQDLETLLTQQNAPLLRTFTQEKAITYILCDRQEWQITIQNSVQGPVTLADPWYLAKVSP